jgi:hypothetical protein
MTTFVASVSMQTPAWPRNVTNKPPIVAEATQDGEIHEDEEAKHGADVASPVFVQCDVVATHEDDL